MSGAKSVSELATWIRYSPPPQGAKPVEPWFDDRAEDDDDGGLEHPSIVPVYGLGTYADGRPFYAMRFIRGDSLMDAIKRFHRGEPGASATGERAVELHKLVRRLIDVCNALQYAHDRGVLHRDI